MPWFDEQLEYRKERDDKLLSDSLESIAYAVMGKRLSLAMQDDKIAKTAIDEILKYYHCQYDEDEEIKENLDIEELLDNRMRSFGIMRRRVELEKGWRNNAVGAMLGTLKEDGQAIALIPGKMTGYTYYDFSTGKRIKVTSKIEGLIDDEALCFYRPLPQRALKILDLVKYVIEQFSVSDFVLYVGGMLVFSLLGLLSPLFTKWLFGDTIYSGKISALISLAVFMICFSLCRTLFSIYQGMVNSRISIKQNIAVEAAVMSRVLSLPASFFKEYSSGELSQRTMYVNSLCSTVINGIGGVGLSAIFSLIYVGQIFEFAPSLVVPALTVTITTVVLNLVLTLLNMKINQKQMMIGSKNSGLTYSTISGIQKIKLAGAEKRMFARWAEGYAKEAELVYNKPMLLKLGDTFALFISLTGTFVMYFIAVHSNISISDYYAFSTSYGMVSGAFFALGGLGLTLANIKPVLEMAKPILEAEPEVEENKIKIDKLKGSIEISNLSFKYTEDMPNVLEDFNLKIKAGEYLAIVGSTGCGKSTLVRLLLGFEKPQKGTIYYDRYDIAKVNIRSLRKKIGAVMQNGKLFTGDIYSNIVISAPQLTVDEAWEAAKIASFDEDIEKMPMGMYTLISEGQGGISGGQKQRLMIARAVAPKPKILILDEATSALDNVTQKAVSEAIDTLKCTRIVIAHRLSTIKNADRIIYINEGHIAEEGTYAELIEKNGLFAELVKRQRIDVDCMD